MALRWVVAAFVETGKSHRKIIGYDQIRMLKARLDDLQLGADMKKRAT